MTRFYAGHNTPGYLPDSDAPDDGFETFDEAKRALIEDMLFVAESLDEDEATDVTLAAEDVNLWSEPSDVIVGGYSWWVTAE